MPISSPFSPTVNSAAAAGPLSDVRQRRHDFKALRDALKSGDVDAAKQAYAAVQKDIEKTTQAGKPNPLDPSTQAGKDFAALGKALDAKDITGAQAAFATLRTDVKNAWQAQGAHQAGRAGHGHKPDNDGDADDGGSAAGGASGGSTLNVTA